MEKDWALIYSTSQIHKSEIVKAVLSDHNIVVSEINKTDSAYAFIPFGEIELYVSHENVIKAKHIISKNNL